MPDQVRRVTHTRITANQGREIEKLKRRPFGGSFDPNENPVIIGEISTSGAGTPDSPASGAARSVVIGYSCDSQWLDSIAIGSVAKVHPSASSGAGAIAIGQGAVVGASGQQGHYAVAIGFGATSYNSSVALGSGAWAKNTNAVAVGVNANASNAESIAVGSAAIATFANNISIGQNAQTHQGSPFGDNSIAIGLDSLCGGSGVNGNDAVAIGHAASSWQTGVAVGYDATTGGVRAVAVGYNARSIGDNCTAIGSGATTGGTGSASAIGTHTTSNYDSSSAIGSFAVTDANSQVMLGGTTHTVVIPNLLEVRGLPTADPGISGRVWNNGGVLTVSP